MNIDQPTNKPNKSISLLICGIGGGGCNTIKNIINFNNQNININNLLAVNTDRQSFDIFKKQNFLNNIKQEIIENSNEVDKNILEKFNELKDNDYICPVLPLGISQYGAGADPEVGLQLIKDTEEQLLKVLDGHDIIVLLSGLGGGTGSAGHEIARMAKGLDKLVISLVTTPFSFEGNARINNANNSLKEYEKYSDMTVAISNDKILQIQSAKQVNVSFKNSFKSIDEIGSAFAVSLFDIIYNQGTINIDFADINRIIRNQKGKGVVGIGFGWGRDAANQALEKALNNPLIKEDIGIASANNLLIHISGDLTLLEINNIITSVTKKMHNKNAQIIYGIGDGKENYTMFNKYFSKALNTDKRIRIMLIATGQTNFETQKNNIDNYQEESHVYEGDQKSLADFDFF